MAQEFKPEMFYFDNEDTVPPRTLESVKRGDPVWSRTDQKFKDIKINDLVLKPGESYARQALARIQEVSLLSTLYFSYENVEEIQRLLRHAVYQRTNGKHLIDKQDTRELLIIMRAAYLEHGRVYTDPKKITEEIRRINNTVLTISLPDLLSNLEQYAGYIRDSTQPWSLLDRPVNPSIKGTLSENRSITYVLTGIN